MLRVLLDVNRSWIVPYDRGGPVLAFSICAESAWLTWWVGKFADPALCWFWQRAMLASFAATVARCRRPQPIAPDPHEERSVYCQKAAEDQHLSRPGETLLAAY